MVGAAGFEPTTFRTRTERDTKLRYAPTNLIILHLLCYFKPFLKYVLKRKIFCILTIMWDNIKLTEKSRNFVGKGEDIHVKDI